MGCFFSCFRFKGDGRKKEKDNLKSSPIPPKNKEPLLSKDNFVSVFIYEGEDPNSQDKFEKEVLESELRKQARFLKSCGALLESPAEFRNAPGLESGLETVALGVSAESVALDVSPSQDDTQTRQPGAGHSPYPTPLKLTDEMETPGTVYTAKQENLRMKHVRVRTQYVYPVLNPVENLSQLTEQREGSLQLCESKRIQPMPVSLSSKNIKEKRSPNVENFDKENYGSVKRQRSGTPLSVCRGGRVMSSSESPQLVVASLSHSLKPPPSNNERNWSGTSAMKDSCLLQRTPIGDRPIPGIASMEDEHCRISPKVWVGNGIPNTTTKYKEDQKVSWHATPFEERLDKALSDNKLFPEREITYRKLVGFEDEDAESDRDTSLGGPGLNLCEGVSYAGQESQ